MRKSFSEVGQSIHLSKGGYFNIKDACKQLESVYRSVSVNKDSTLLNNVF